MKRITEQQLPRWIKGIFLTLLGVGGFACNDLVENRLKDRYDESGTAYQSGRVLMIVVDGMSGEAVKNAINQGKAPVLSGLTEQALYSWEGLSDHQYEGEVIPYEQAVANLMTGTTRHGVTDELANYDPQAAPVFVQRIKEAKPAVRTALYASGSRFATAFGSSFDTSTQTEEQEKVVEQLILALQEETPAGLIMGQFNHIQKIGQSAGFYTLNETGQGATPTEAILEGVKEIDRWIGQIMDALQSRENFEKENWLVVVTSEYGGESPLEPNIDLFEDPGRNMFTLMYNSRLLAQRIQKPVATAADYSFFSPYYSGDGAITSAAVQDPSLFDMEQGKSYTIQFAVRDFNVSADGEQAILSKTTSATVGKPGNGWKTWYYGSKTMRFSARSAVDTQITSDYGGGTFNRREQKWSVLTFVFDYDQTFSNNEGRGTFRCYNDGNLFREAAFTRSTDPSSPEAPLRVGIVPGTTSASALRENTRFLVNNIQFYDIALPDEFIRENYCKVFLDDIHMQKGYEYWDNLIGYWPCDREEDFGGDYLYDYSQYGSKYGGINAGRSDMKIEGGKRNAWMEYASVENDICITDTRFFSQGMKTLDVPYQIIQWMGITVDPSWGLEGTARSLRYAWMGEE